MAGTIYVSLRSLHPQQGAQWRGGLVESQRYISNEGTV